MHRLVLLRHGQSTWNLENRFTGWTDVDLSPQGVEEAHSAGQVLRGEGCEFDLIFTSVLKRAIHTLQIAVDVLDQAWVPVVRHWRLNERHYGALQGLNKAEMAATYGEEQVKIWRRSYATPPPPLEPNDPRSPTKDRRYANLSPSELPLTESLKNTVARFVPYWEQTIAPEVRAGRRVLIAAHGNSLRALVKHLDRMSDDAVVECNIPTGIPLFYELDAQFRPIQKRYLGDPETVRRAAEAVANQGKAK